MLRCLYRCVVLDENLQELIRVGDVMTPWNELSLLNYQSLETLSCPIQ